MRRIKLSSKDLDLVKTLIYMLKKRYGDAHNKEFLIKARYYASLLPSCIAEFCNEARYNVFDSGISVLSGFIDEPPGPTPKSWDYDDSYRPSLDIDFFAILLSSNFGQVFGWATQQKAKLIHDLIPQKGKETSQAGYGSTSELVLHTEDSFHPCKGDFICMYAVRNDDAIPTTMASIRELQIPSSIVDVLFEERFVVKADESHLDPAQRSDVTNDLKSEVSQDSLTKISVLYGSRHSPFLCYDPAYTDVGATDSHAIEALDILTTEIKKNIRYVPLQHGDFCIIDNRKVVHGRSSFTPKFDGTDRWLKRISITSNLRKSIKHRECIDSLIIW